MDGSVELSSGSHCRVLAIELKLEDLTVATSDNEFISGDWLDSAHTESAQIEAEHEHLSLDMEAVDFTGCCACNKIVLLVLREGHADVVTDMGACVDDL